MYIYYIASEDRYSDACTHDKALCIYTPPVVQACMPMYTYLCTFEGTCFGSKIPKDIKKQYHNSNDARLLQSHTNVARLLQSHTNVARLLQSHTNVARLLQSRIHTEGVYLGL